MDQEDFELFRDPLFLAALFADDMEDFSDFWHPSVTVPDDELLNMVLQFEKQNGDKIQQGSAPWNDVSMDDHELRQAVEKIEAR